MAASLAAVGTHLFNILEGELRALRQQNSRYTRSQHCRQIQKSFPIAVENAKVKKTLEDRLSAQGNRIYSVDSIPF
jgi:hypothetical protein